MSNSTETDILGRRTVALGVTLVAVTIPFLSVTFPPSTDLPQHVAQLRLLEIAISEPSADYAVQWATPYWLGYGFIGLWWELSPPLAVGKWALWSVVLTSTVALHGLAWALQRPPSHPAVASLFLFSESLYWGFLPFMAGFPVFVGWFLLSIRTDDWSEHHEYAALAGFAWVLYFAHALWWAAGFGWLVVHTVFWCRNRARAAIRLLVSALPVCHLLFWFPRLESGGFVSNTVWNEWPIARLTPDWLVSHTLGMIVGFVPYLLSAIVLVWMVGGAASHYFSGKPSDDGKTEKSPRVEPSHAGIDRSLAAASVTFLAATLLLPSKFTNTVSFGSRWLAPALMFAVLAVPFPVGPTKWLRRFALAFVLASGLFVGSAWSEFEQEELHGLAPAVRAVPEDSSVLGVDFRRTTELLRHRPFMQAHAYTQVLRGASLNFSFADFPVFPVVYSPRRQKPWTNGLEWFPNRVDASDFRHFEYTLVNATPRLHRRLSERFNLRFAAGNRFWRLYRTE